MNQKSWVHLKLPIAQPYLEPQILQVSLHQIHSKYVVAFLSLTENKLWVNFMAPLKFLVEWNESMRKKVLTFQIPGKEIQDKKVPVSGDTNWKINFNDKWTLWCECNTHKLRDTDLPEQWILLYECM